MQHKTPAQLKSKHKSRLDQKGITTKMRQDWKGSTTKPAESDSNYKSLYDALLNQGQCKRAAGSERQPKSPLDLKARPAGSDSKAGRIGSAGGMLPGKILYKQNPGFYINPVLPACDLHKKQAKELIKACCNESARATAQ